MHRALSPPLLPFRVHHHDFTTSRLKAKKQQQNYKIQQNEDAQAYDFLLIDNRAFSTDESFLRDPNAYNDKINEGAKDGEGIIKPGFRL
jgi:hypothetical protein